MTAVFLGRFEPGSPEWLAARAHGLGGSEIAPVLGLSPFESRFALWHRKAALAGPVVETEIMEAGKRLEPAILQRFADDHPEWHVGGSATFCHSERPWQIANPDGLIFHSAGDFLDLSKTWAADALAEAKFALYPDGWGEPGTGQIPIYYQCQLQWYLDVFGLETGYVEVFIGSQGRFAEYVVHADERGQKLLRDRAEQFLASLDRGERPSIDAHDATYQVVRELHPLIEPRSIEVPAEVAIPYARAKHAESLAKAAAQQATAVLADAMGNAKTATFLGQPFAGRRAKKGGTPYVQAADNLKPFDIDLKEAS